MIISPSLGFLFIKIPKTASSSFEAALNPFLAPTDIVTPLQENLNFFSRGMTPLETNPLLLTRAVAKSMHQIGAGPTVKSIFHDLQFANENRVTSPYFWKYYHHITLKKIERRLDANIYKKIAKIAIARHPFTRIMSAYRYRVGKDRKYRKENPDFLEWYSREKHFFPPMVTYIQDSSGFNLDLLIRYENLDEGIFKFAKLIGLEPKQFLATFKEIAIHSSKGGYGNQSLYGLKNLAPIEDLIRKDYADDFEYFKYE